jgi:acetyltransferase-like isoleucine patch superfamily enzyme
MITKNVKIGIGTYVGPNTIIGYPTHETILKAQEKNVDPYDITMPTVIGKDCSIQPGAIIWEGTNIGANSIVGNNAVIRENNTIGSNTIIASLCALERSSNVGDYVTIATQSHITLDSTIEDHVFFGAQVVTMNTSLPLHLAPSSYEKHEAPIFRKACTIGCNATILPGVEIGENALVAAGSVVTKSVPPRKVAMGVPARIKSDIPEDLYLDNRLKLREQYSQKKYFGRIHDDK